MDLDIGTILLGILCAAICIVPFVLMGRSRRQREQQKLNWLENIAKKHNSRITHHEFCGNLGIALDDKRSLAFFIKEIDGEIFEDYIDLNQMKECRVIRTNISVPKNKENYPLIERLDLCFVPLDSKAKEIKWEFFSREHNLQFYGELQVIEKWDKLLNEQIGFKVW